jgi:hypothetical protein
VPREFFHQLLWKEKLQQLERGDVLREGRLALSAEAREGNVNLVQHTGPFLHIFDRSGIFLLLMFLFFALVSFDFFLLLLVFFVAERK